MEYINKYVGVFDFWSVFCCGIVSLTSYIVVYGKNFLDMGLKEFPLFLYIVIAYVIGLILYTLSSVLIDCNILKLRTGQVTSEGYIEKRLFIKYYNQYWADNDLIKKETKDIGFQKCYNYLKHFGNMTRIDKLHSLYGMARGISLGYFILTILTLVNLFIKFKELSFFHIMTLLIYAMLTLTFYKITKKYFYRWIEWVFIEYQYMKSEEHSC